MGNLNLDQIAPGQEVNKNFADKTTPEAHQAYRRANEPEEEALMTRARMETGEKVLESTLVLIRERLQKKFGNDRRYNKFIKDRAAIAEIKEKLLENIRETGGDQREDVVEEVVERLMNQ